MGSDMLRIGVLWLVAVLVVVLPANASADKGGFTTKARQAILVDGQSGSILFSHNPDVRRPPASMSKLMTLALIFKALKATKLSLTDQIVVSENAWRTGGAPSRTSSMFVPINKSASVEQMIRGLVIQSGNDAAIAIAEHMAGSEELFAKQMDKEAQRLGLTNSTFGNASGLPHPRQLMSARDIAILARYLIYSLPEYYPYFAEREFKYRRFRFINRNRLLFMKLGVDGLKTGATKEAGYGVVASAVRKGRRLIAVLGGLKSKKERWAEARRLIQWGFNDFAPFKVFEKGEVVGQARVWGGDRLYVPLIGRDDVRVYLPRFPVNQRLRGEVIYTGPLKPPIRRGDQVAMLRVTSSTGAQGQVPLFAAESVERAGLMRRGLDSLFHLAFSWVP
ncbi:MAG: D-alanyl-D-alanine carboxypeptidase family protein [Hyphomicrobiaceae bacterium]